MKIHRSSHIYLEYTLFGYASIKIYLFLRRVHHDMIVP